MAETPEAYYRRMSEPLDFEPGCEIDGCEQRASQGMRCTSCSAVHILLCGAHAGVSQRSLRDDVVTCPECGAEGVAKALAEWRPLAGWFA